VIFTVGHSTRPQDELIAILEEAGVELLVDVRRFPGSRRHPQFGQEALRVGLAGAGIGYKHEPELGGRRAPRPDSPNTGWRVAAFRGYADHMARPEFRRTLDRLVGSPETPTALMCAEALPRKCHRQLIADALTARGVEVVHLLGRGQRQVHVLNPGAIVEDEGVLVYPGDQADLTLLSRSRGAAPPPDPPVPPGERERRWRKAPRR
jgi:uncharacterized protein (DUF488 family)